METETTQKTTQKTKNQIVEIMKSQPKITQAELADLLGVTINGVKYHIKKLKQDGIIERIGGDKGGYWIVK